MYRALSMVQNLLKYRSASNSKYYNLQFVIHVPMGMNFSSWQAVEIFITESADNTNVSVDIDTVIDRMIEKLVSKPKANPNDFPLQIISDACFTKDILQENGYVNYGEKFPDYIAHEDDAPHFGANFTIDPYDTKPFDASSFRNNVIQSLKLNHDAPKEMDESPKDKDDLHIDKKKRAS